MQVSAEVVIVETMACLNKLLALLSELLLEESKCLLINQILKIQHGVNIKLTLIVASIVKIDLLCFPKCKGIYCNT